VGELPRRLRKAQHHEFLEPPALRNPHDVGIAVGATIDRYALVRLACNPCGAIAP
jgi:hypothetical protein